MIKRSQIKKTSEFWLILLSLTGFSFFLLSLIYGALLNYSAVPFSDTWEGAINFYLEAQSNPAAWWQQHFDHRIFFSKLIFWIDLRFFDGQNLIYFPVHLILLSVLFAVYIAYARKLMQVLFEERATLSALVALAGLFAFSWMQRQNIAWEFQSQFILVYLLPLIAFYCFAQAQYGDDERIKRRWLFAALVLGLASAHSMANGIVALPLLVFMGALLGLPKRQLLLIGGLAIFSLAVFFIGYEKTPGQNFGPALLMHHPLKVLSFALTYLGNPFYLATLSVPLAITAALIAVSTIIYIFFRNSQLRKNPFSIALFTYILFVGSSALLTAFGRALFSLEMAASSRYTTPALTFWMVTILLLLAHFNSARLPLRLLVGILAVAFSLLIKTQISALYFAPPLNWLPFTKKVSALSLQLDINDQSARRSLYPISDSRDVFFERARQAGITIFSEAVAFPANRLNTIVDPSWDLCSVNIRQVALVDAEVQAYRVNGDLKDSIKLYRYVFFADENRTVKGIALLGKENIGDPNKWLPQLDWILHPINYSVFNGYLLGIDKPMAYCL